MLRLKIPAREYFSDETNEFITIGETRTIQLEHSLVSLSKWESKWKKPFLTEGRKPQEEFLDYVRCMTITQNVPKETYLNITPQLRLEIEEYMNDKMTATTFNDLGRKPPSRANSRFITSELIYYWMISYGVPMECQKWHLNRLMTLIEVCARESQPSKKMTQKDVYEQYKRINALNKSKFHTKG